MKALLDVHNIIMRKCLRRHRGYEVKTEGDAFMISFQHATQGLGFALDVQARLHAAQWPDFLLKVCLGRGGCASRAQAGDPRVALTLPRTLPQSHRVTRQPNPFTPPQPP